MVIVSNGVGEAAIALILVDLTKLRSLCALRIILISPKIFFVKNLAALRALTNGHLGQNGPRSRAQGSTEIVLNETNARVIVLMEQTSLLHLQ